MREVFAGGRTCEHGAPQENNDANVASNRETLEEIIIRKLETKKIRVRQQFLQDHQINVMYLVNEVAEVKDGAE